jgi:hypothetical protein
MEDDLNFYLKTALFFGFSINDNFNFSLPMHHLSLAPLSPSILNLLVDILVAKGALNFASENYNKNDNYL